MPSSLDPPILDLELPPYRGPEDDPPPLEGGWLASVALILRASPSSESPELLLIRRSDAAGDLWSGHMALPGGRKDPGDPSLLHTAIREAREEVGLTLDRSGPPLGRLQAVRPQSPRLPRFTVLPLVFHLESGEAGRVASPAEVAELHWVSLSHLRSPRNRTTFEMSVDGGQIPFPAIDVAGRSVWGLTHRILRDFLGRVR